MTVKELKEILNQFDDNLFVMIPNMNWGSIENSYPYIHATKVNQGVNEVDYCIFIDDYEES